jgi:hypothetical protein
MVIPPQFNSAGHFHEGRAWVRIGGKYGYIDKYGTLVIPNEFTWAGNFHSGRAAVMVNEVGAYIDLAGKVVIQLSPVMKQCHLVLVRGLRQSVKRASGVTSTFMVNGRYFQLMIRRELFPLGLRVLL